MNGYNLLDSYIIYLIIFPFAFEHKIMAQVYNDYLKKQTNDIIEKRAQARVIEKSVKLEMRHQSTQRNSLYLDQIKMYKNELESAQKEQENLTKGIKLDTKLRMREEKSILRQDIRRMKEKTICKDDFRLDEDVEKMIESIRVNTRRPNRRRLVS